MEVTSTKAKRTFRSEQQIKDLLNDYRQSGLSIKSYCNANQIAQGSFHNWLKKYNVQAEAGFANINVLSSTSPALFAQVGSIMVYQPVSASYLKELLS